MQLELKVFECKVWRKRMKGEQGEDHMHSLDGSSKAFGLPTNRSHRAVGSNVSFRKGTKSVLM